MPEATPRSHPAVILAIVVAALSVTAAALVAIALMVGWIPSHSGSGALPGSMAFPAQRATGTADGVALLPGETLVTPSDAPAPSTKAAPGPGAPSAAKPGPTAPVYRHDAPRAAPEPAPEPKAARRPSTALAKAPRSHAVCANCGRVASVRETSDGWDVRVRFDDGDSATFRYPTAPRVRSGERVRFEDGRLVRAR